MGRDAGDVRGIKLKEGDWCVGGGEAPEGAALLSITENGFGKRTLISEYFRGGESGGEPQNRGGMGMKNYNITEKTGIDAAAKVVNDEDDVLIISEDGTMIRMAASGISLYGRATQGVRVMKVPEGVKVISVARTDKEPGEEETVEAETVEE